MANIAVTTYCNLHCEYCVPAGTKVLMGNGTTKNIEDIIVGDVVMGFNENSETYKQRRITKTTVTNVMSRETNEIYKITMSDGKTIEITGNHPVLNGRNKWTEVSNLREETSEIKSLGYFPDDKDRPDINNIDYIKGYFIGMWMSDGSYKAYDYGEDYREGRNSNVIYSNRIAVKDSEIIERMKRYCDILNFDYQIRQFNISKKYDEYCDAIFSGKKESYEYIVNLERSLRDNFDTYLNNDDFVKGFCAAAYDSEGHIDKCTYALSIANSDELILDMWENGLKKFGFETIRNFHNETNVPVYTSRMLTGGNPTGSEQVRFFTIFNPAVSRKTYSVFENSCVFYNNLIEKIEKIEKNITVYNFETDSHTYIAEGLAVHNCFAHTMIEEMGNPIDLEQFRMILNWIARTPQNHIGLIGGEPLVHPHIDEIFKEVNIYCRQYNTSCTLFTNGVYLLDHMNEIGDGIHLLINVNHPSGMSAEQWTKLNQSLDKASEMGWFLPGRGRANIGCNLYMERSDYSFFWEIVDRYRIDHVRTSVTAPVKPEYQQNKERYYTDMKPIFMRFLEEAERRGVSLGADCNQIPDCYFTPEELDRIYRIMPDRHSCICHPVVDITPDFTATACFGCYDPVDCSDFETLPQLEDYLLHKKTYPRFRANCTGKCTGCKKHELLKCEGGCLAFADKEKIVEFEKQV